MSEVAVTLAVTVPDTLPFFSFLKSRFGIIVLTVRLLPVAICCLLYLGLPLKIRLLMLNRTWTLRIRHVPSTHLTLAILSRGGLTVAPKRRRTPRGVLRKI